MKFDICLMNPPYGRGLHEKFLIRLLNISNKICTVQPLTWLLTTKKQNKEITKYLDEFGGIIEQINGNKEFDAGIAGNIGICYINTLKKSKIKFKNTEYNNCSEISNYSDDSMLSVFANINIDKNCYEHLTFISNIKNNKSIYNKFCVCIARIRGNVTSNTDEQHSNNYYTFISNNINKVHSGVINDIISKKLKDDFRTFVFVNKQNLNGFINYIKTDFVRAILKLYKNNMNINIGIFKHIPWFNFSDNLFSKTPKEIDDWLFKKYNISDEIRKHIEEILPDYYNIRKGHS